MIAVILAAGMSKRMRPLTNTFPKCLLPIHGETLLSRYLDLLEEVGITDVLIVVGFNTQAVRDEAYKKTRRINIHITENTAYESTHPIESFLLAESFITTDFLLLNSDLYFPVDVLRRLIVSKNSSIAINSHAAFVPDEMFVNYMPNMQVTAISKKLMPLSEGQGKSVQIAKFLYGDRKDLFERARALAGQADMFYPTEAYDTLIKAGRFFAVDMAGIFTHELDTVEDYEILLKQIHTSA